MILVIVAYGYGLDQFTNVFVNDIVLALTDEPVITLDEDLTITLDQEGVAITLDDDIQIEVE